VSNVRALEDRHPIVRSQRPRQLPIPDIDGDHVASTPLQENLSEATGRGSGVQRIRVPDVETERLQSSDQLVGAPGDEVRPGFGDQFDRGRIVHLGRGFRCGNSRDADAAPLDRGTALLARGNQASAHQLGV